MKCPKNTAACKVRKKKQSKETFGSPPTSSRMVYQCEFHGFFVHDVEKNFISSFSSEMPEID